MKKIFSTLIISLFIIGSVFAFGQKEERDMDKITGVPIVYGAAPHTYICIETDSGKVYYVHTDNQKEIIKLDRYKYIFTVEFIAGPPVSLEATFHKDGTVRVLSWKRKDSNNN